MLAVPLTARVPRAWLLTAGLALGWLLLAPRTPDLAAQVYRTRLFEDAGWALWDDFWFSGHHLPAYSLLFPPLGATFGPRTVGALAAVASAVLFERLLRGHVGVQRARAGAWWFAAAAVADLCIGRLTYALGVALALGALAAWQTGRVRLAVLLAAATAVGSPVAAAFLALAATALLLAAPAHRRAAVAVAVTALGVAAALAAAFPEGGRQPMGHNALAAVLAAAAVLVVLLPRAERALRTGAALYLLAALAVALVASPMGANVTRLGATFAGPLLVAVVPPQAWTGTRRWVLAVVITGLAAWQWYGPVTELSKAVGDPSVDAAFYAPLRAQLAARGGPVGRLEVPFTRSHWEATHLTSGPGASLLARGWSSQLDHRDNELLFSPDLTPEAYHAYLRDRAVRHVAVPDVPLDPGGRPEARLIAGGLDYLRPVWRGRHWTLYELTDPLPLLTGSGVVEAVDRRGITVRVDRAGSFVLRIRRSPYAQVRGGPGCLGDAPGGWTRLRADRPGRLRVEHHLRPLPIVEPRPECPT